MLPVLPMARGIWPIRKRCMLRSRMPTFAIAVFLRCSSSVSPNISNRRVRTRTHGGVAGVGGRPPPLCRSSRHLVEVQLSGCKSEGYTVIRPLETTCVHQRKDQGWLDTPRKTGSWRRPLGLVKFAVPEFLDLSLKGCTLGGVCRDDLQTISSTIPPSPAGQLAGSFLMCQALPTTGANG